MPKHFTHCLAMILSACLLLTSCGPGGGPNQNTQNQIDKAQAQQTASNFVAAVKHNVGVLAWQMLPSHLQDGQSREFNPHIQTVSCGEHVLAYVPATNYIEHQNALKLSHLNSLQALRITSAMRQLWPQSAVGLATTDGTIIGGLNGLSPCTNQLETARANQNLGAGPVVVVPLSTVTDTLNGFDPTADIYNYVPINANNPCAQKLQACHLDSTSKQVVCRDATEPQGPSMPLTKDNCVQATEPVSVADNTDITLWENAVRDGIITSTDAYTISGGVVTKLTTAMAQKLDCPADAEGTGIVENPQVTRTTGWTSDGSGRAPVSNPGSVVSCQNGWQGTLYAKYERRSCSLKKITSTGAGVATTDTKPQTVFQLYYVGAKCQTASPVVKTATCSASVANSNGSGNFTISRHFAMTQPIALTWTNTKNKSSSQIAKDGDRVLSGYTVLPTLSNKPFSSALADALQARSVLQKSTSCNVGNACDISVPNPPAYAGFVCPDGWSFNGDGKCSFTSATPDECPPNSTKVTIDGVDKCALDSGRVCMGGDPNNGCKGQCPDGTAGSGDPKTCKPNKVCKPGDHGDGTTCTRDAVCPSTQAPPNADGSCPSSGGSGGTDTIECPAGTTPIKVANVITGCEGPIICEPDKVPTAATGALNIVLDTSISDIASIDIPYGACVGPTAAGKKCYGLDGRKSQPQCYGANSCVFQESSETGNLNQLIDLLRSETPSGISINVINGDHWLNNPNIIKQINSMPSGYVIGFTETDDGENRLGVNMCASPTGGYAATIKSGTPKTYCYTTHPFNGSPQNGSSMMYDVYQNRSAGMEINFFGQQGIIGGSGSDVYSIFKPNRNSQQVIETIFERLHDLSRNL